MEFIRKMERKYGHLAIKKLYAYIIGAIVIGYILYYMLPDIYYYLAFYPYEVVVLHQYWRLFTWVFTIPYTLDSYLNMLFLPLNLFFYYFVGRNLENIFGRFSFNLYVFGGMLLTTIGMLISSFGLLSFGSSAEGYRELYKQYFDLGYNSMTLFGEMPDTHYMLISIFFAFALIYGDMIVRLYFVIPIKVRWSAYITGIFMIYDFLRGNLFSRVIIVCSVLNFLIYFLIYKRFSPKDRLRSMKYKNAVKKAERRPAEGSGAPLMFPSSATIHRCAVCGRTEKDDENMEFRYCSKCDGSREYCQDHLYTHQHIVNSGE